jgi:hypothetical protein
MDRTAAPETFDRLRRVAGRVSAAELDEVWAALDTVRPQDILGAWRGGDFDTGHPAHLMLEKSRWHGKRFDSVGEAHPLIRRDEHGALFSDDTMGKGLASLWTVEFRGESTATMVYDGQPVLDHFKQVRDGVLMGIMNGRDVLHEGQHYYFFLELESDN